MVKQEETIIASFLWCILSLKGVEKQYKNLEIDMCEYDGEKREEEETDYNFARACNIILIGVKCIKILSIFSSQM